MRESTQRNLRVGMLTVLALAALGVAIFTIGKRQQLFMHHTRYYTTFSNVMWLQRGAPVNLDGVTVGFVERIVLPTDPADQRIRVEFTVQADYTERIRTDTKAYIKTIGLLGDKYLELRGGSPEAKRALEGGYVPGQDPAEVTRFLASGEDLMANLLAISSSLRVILQRVEAGEGLLGELTVNPDNEPPVGDRLRHTVITLNRILDRIDRGEGLVGRLVSDDASGKAMLQEIRASNAAVRAVAEALRRDLSREDTAWAGVVRDPEGRQLVRETLQSLHDASQALAAASQELATGEGTLPRLLRDGEYAGDFLTDLEQLADHLRSVVEKLDRGEGTAGALINDPQLYQDLENVVQGVKHSKILSWFIRNRRKAGEKVLAKQEQRSRKAETEE